MERQRDGILDTSVVIDSLMRTGWSAACSRFLADVAAGSTTVTVEPIVVHELTYAVSRVRKDLDRKAVAETILVLLAGAGVDEPTGLIAGAVETWRDAPQLSFVDAPDLREMMGTGRRSST